MNKNKLIYAISFIVGFILGYFSLNFKEAVCVYNSDRAYHQEERKACERLGQTLGCDLYQMDTQVWSEINLKHNLELRSCER